MSTTTLEKGGWNRVHFYSSLFDYEPWGSRKKRTTRQKFIHQGKSALKLLLRLNYLTFDEAEWASKSVIEQISPGTLNGAAIALVCTTYDPKSQKFLFEPDAFSTGSYRAYQKKKCWRTLTKTLASPDSNLSSFLQEYGITSVDLLRYFFLLRNGKWATYTEEEEEGDEETMYED